MNFLAVSSLEERRAPLWPMPLGYESYRARIEAHARRLGESPESAEEIAQDALLIAHRSPPDSDGNVLAWFLTVTTRLALSAKRNRSRRPLYSAWDAALIEGTSRDDLIPAPEAEDEPVVSDEARALFSALVRTLPDELRIPVLMIAANRSYREIAAEMVIPIGTVRSRVHRARQRMRGQVLSLSRSLP